MSAGRVNRVSVNGDIVSLTLSFATPDPQARQQVEDQVRSTIKALGGVREVMIMTKGPTPAAPEGAGGPQPQTGNPFDAQAPIEGVKNIIAVASAKGGVGKSTVCVNLALAAARQGARVGLVDVDVYGPSIHILLGTEKRPMPGATKEIAPIEIAGIQMMSLGLLTDPGEAMIWRGPIVMGVVKKFLQDVEWKDLDYLFVDMPPGTGDAQLTLAQTVPVTGAVIVTTPSKLALVDAEKGLQMFRKVEVPVLGIVENMSYFVCPHCDGRTDIFNYGGARETAQRLGTRYLGDIPLDPAVRAAGDEGEPIVLRSPDSPVARAFLDIAAKVRELCPAGDPR